MATYAHRVDVPAKQWWDLLVGARRQIDLFGYAMLFLPEAHPRLADLLRGKAAADCKVRILLGDPDSRRQVAELDAEERLDGALVGRVRNSLVHFRSLVGVDGVKLHLHATPPYNSTFRFDEEMFVTPHLYGVPGSWAPLLHLRRLGNGGIFDRFAPRFQGVWATSTTWEPNETGSPIGPVSRSQYVSAAAVSESSSGRSRPANTWTWRPSRRFLIALAPASAVIPSGREE